MNLLVTLNSAYINPLCVMLRSLSVSNAGEYIRLYVAHSSLTDSDFEKIAFAVSDMKCTVVPIKLDDTLFENAPCPKRISKETYYRIFAPLYLPEDVDRILYIDPDTVVINNLSSFYNSFFGDKLLIGAKHFDGLMDVWNRGRLGMHKSERYINAGIMLMNIRQLRKDFDKDKLFSIIKKYHRILFLADQDAINILYDGKIGLCTEYKINLDERTFAHMLKRMSVADALDFVKHNTLIVHYNGKNKPWKDAYEGYLKCFYDDSVANKPLRIRRGA